MKSSGYYPLSDFPQLELFCKHWMEIRAEFLTLDIPVMPIHRQHKSHQEVYREVLIYLKKGGTYGWLQGWSVQGPDKEWLQFALMAFDQVLPFAQALMPKTCALLADLKGIKVCALNQMASNKILPTHTHPELKDEGLLQLHLTLDSAEQKNFAYLNVNGEFLQHTQGDAFVFDGSLPHFALNASKQARTILYLEFDPKHQS